MQHFVPYGALVMHPEASQVPSKAFMKQPEADQHTLRKP